MAADAAQSALSADSYIGSFISLVSKAEIRYEGFLFHISPQESTIGLRNVKSFGTEGRRKDGPQVLSSDKVYDYIYFRGGDIKDLQVISSPNFRSTPALPNDPAIIQSSYPISTSASSSFSSAAAPATNIISNVQLGLPNSNFESNVPQSQAVGTFGSWGSLLPPPTANGNGIAVPTYWPGQSGSSGGVSYFQQHSLLRSPQGFLVSPPVQEPMKNSTTNVSLPAEILNSAEFYRPLLPTVGTGSPSSIPPVPTSSALPSSFSIKQSTIFPFKLSPNLMPENVSDAPHAPTLASSLPFASPLVASSEDVSPVVPLVKDVPKSVLDPALPSQTLSQTMPSIIGSSGPVQSEASIPSLLTPSQLLQPWSTGQSSPHMQTVHEDIELDHLLRSESQSSDSISAGDAAQPLPSSVSELNRTDVRSYYWSQGGNVRGRGHWLHGAASRGQHSYRGDARGRAYGPNGAVLHPYQSNRGHFRGRNIRPTSASVHAHRGGRGHGCGKGTREFPPLTKFMEDFDFKAMNEKFNKEEIWGHLGKSSKTRLEDNEGEENDDGANDTEGEYEEEESPTSDSKPVYVKDEFFDSLSCNSFNPKSGRGRARLFEQRRIDIETFGEIPRHRRGHSSRGPGWGGQSRGSRRGRGYGYVGRGRGQTVWSRVT